MSANEPWNIAFAAVALVCLAVTVFCLCQASRARDYRNAVYLMAGATFPTSFVIVICIAALVGGHLR